MNIEIGSFEAKTKLPALLREVQRGKSYTITLRGKAIADLIPSKVSQDTEVAAAVTNMQHFMDSHPPLLGVNTKALAEEGRD